MERSRTSWRRGATVLIATAALGGAMAFGACAAPVAAWAAEGDATVRIIPAEGNGITSYRAYRLFTATIEPDDGNVDVAHDVAWDAAVTDDERQQIADWLKTKGYDAWLARKGFPKRGDDVSPLNAFEFINERINESAQGSTVSIDGKKVVASGSFAMEFAQWVQRQQIGAVITVPVTGTDAKSAQIAGPEGYYLVMSGDIAPHAASAATAPIWIAVGGQTATVREKTSVPTVDKTVAGLAGGNENGGSAQIGDVFTFTVEATLPANYASYDAFKVVLTDTPVNLAFVEGSAVVKSGTKDITASATIEYGANGTSLKATIADLKTADADANKDTVVTLTYKAKLTSDAVTTPGGNKNEIEYEYSNKPGTDGTGSNKDTPVPVHTYALDLVKQDKGSDAALAGAKFIIKDASGSYYNKDTKLWDLDEAGAKGNPLVTDDQGVTDVITGLKVGTYTLTEIEAPAGYETPSGRGADIALTVSAAYDEATGELEPGTLKIEAEGALVDKGDTGAAKPDEGTGHLKVYVENDKNIALAMTGAEGVGLAGAGVLGVGLVWYLVRNRRKDGERA